MYRTALTFGRKQISICPARISNKSLGFDAEKTEPMIWVETGVDTDFYEMTRGLLKR